MKNFGSFVSRTHKIVSVTAIAFISLLIFLSIIPLASADVWSEAVILCAVFVLSAATVWFGELRLENRRLLTPLLLLALYSFIQGTATAAFQTGTAFYPQSFDLTASFWNAFKIFALALFLGLLFVNFRRHVKFLTWFLISTGVLFAAFGIARFLFQESFPGIFASFLSSQLAPGIGFGTFFNQNHFATLMLMAFGLSIGLLRFGRQSAAAKIFLLAGGLLMWTALVLTASRGGIIGSFAEIAVLVLLPLLLAMPGGKSRRGRENHTSKFALVGRQIAILTVFLGFLMIGVYLLGQDRIVGRFEEISEQLGGVTNAATFRRPDVWQAAVGIIKDFPLFGIGFGGFQFAVSQYIDISGQLVPKQAHNDYLELAASAGIVGVALGVWFVLRFFSLFKQRFALPSDDFYCGARLGAICGIAGVALHSFFDFSLQVSANLLFFKALIFIAVHQSPDKSETARDFSSGNVPAAKLLFTILLVVLIFGASFFGLSRYRLERSKNASPEDFIENVSPRIPFDANFHETKAAVYETAQNLDRAADELKKAVEFRPKDYNLQLKLGKIEQSRNRPAEAETAFRRAIELAPRYGAPHFFYGNFLVNTDRRNEGFAELRLASHRNPYFFDQVVERVWNENGGNADELVKILSPLDANEAEKISQFLFDKENFPALVRFACREETVSNERRDWLIKKLLEKNNYHFAERIYRRSCDAAETASLELEDGGFENGEVREGIGFGWRVQLDDQTIVALDQGNGGQGQSLRLTFNGQEESFALLSQIVTLEKKRRYQLDFAYRTEKIVTGGVPVIQIAVKQAGSEIIAREEKLSLKENAGWIQTSIEFETGERAEAVEIRLTRQNCAESLCPIFGKLWLDDFRLRKKN